MIGKCSITTQRTSRFSRFNRYLQASWKSFYVWCRHCCGCSSSSVHSSASSSPSPQKHHNPTTPQNTRPKRILYLFLLVHTALAGKKSLLFLGIFPFFPSKDISPSPIFMDHEASLLTVSPLFLCERFLFPWVRSAKEFFWSGFCWIYQCWLWFEALSSNSK